MSNDYLLEDDSPNSNPFAPEIVRLNHSASREAKAILVHAYKQTRIFKYIFESQKPGYLQRVRASIRALMELHLDMHQEAIGLVVKGRLVGVALLGIPEMRVNLASHWGWRLKMIMTTGLNCTSRYIDYHQKVNEIAPFESFNQLPLLGIDSSFQGKGLGRLLLKSIIQIAFENPSSSGILLDTGEEAYLPFYEGLGFNILGKIDEGEFDEYVLFRENKCIE
jgi:GNAT superfamily N-acetyltransferase